LVCDFFEEDGRFIGRCSSERDRAYEVVRFRVRDRYGYTVQQSERYKALFLIPEAVVFEGERRTIEHLMRIDEVDAVVLEVLQSLNLVPLELHLRIVYTLTAECNAEVLLPDNAAVEPPRDALSGAQQAHNEMARLLRARDDVSRSARTAC
jgi:hypothetical protein